MPAMAVDPFYAIGDPGRAAREVPSGPPPTRAGRSDVELSSADLPGMLIRAASCRGILHRSAATVRQDAFALAQCYGPDEPAAAITVVCDGVGSLEKSDWAADLVSRDLALLGAAGTPWPDAFREVNEKLRKHAAEGLPAGAPLEMATTAVALRVCREDGDWVGDAAWVADSSLWHLDDNDHWTMLAGPPGEDADDYHSGHVRPMPSDDCGCSAARFRVSGGALFLMTDGVANPLMWAPDVQQALAQWWRRPPDPFTFAGQVGFAKRTHVDDRTVVGIWSTRDASEQDATGEPQAAL